MKNVYFKIAWVVTAFVIYVCGPTVVNQSYKDTPRLKYVVSTMCVDGGIVAAGLFEVL